MKNQPKKDIDPIFDCYGYYIQNSASAYQIWQEYKKEIEEIDKKFRYKTRILLIVSGILFLLIFAFYIQT
jgi:hypothetical protein